MSNDHYLKPLLEPQSLAIIGASDSPDAIGHVILRNILAGGFKGKVWAVNPKYGQILGQPCVTTVQQIGAQVDLAIVTTPPNTMPQLIEQCARAGIRHLVLITSPASTGQATLEKRILDTARQAGVRLLGPKSLGVIRPRLALNATFTEASPLPGELALVTQSGAMCASLLDWATLQRIGVSSVVALGSALDVDFGEILDFLAHDDDTRYILLHVERVRNARSFMSALRSATRSKPVILFKSGEPQPGQDADQGLLSDAVFDAAVRRAGVLQVRGISQLFHAAKALATHFRPRSPQLAIISNGTGPAAMATDAARRFGVPLAQLSGPTVEAMKPLLPRDWKGGNPVDLGGDATPGRYLQTIEALRQDEQIGAILVVLSPLAMVQPVRVAEGIARLAAESRVPLCCCFMGGEQIAPARRLLEEAGVPVFRSPETMVELLHDIWGYYDNQKLMLQAPSLGEDSGNARSGNAGVLVDTLLAQNRRLLSALETRALLRSFGIGAAPMMIARSPSEAMFMAEQIGLPVDMRLDCQHRAEATDAPLERLKLSSLESVRLACQDLLEAARKAQPGQALDGVTLEAHSDRPHARRLGLSVLRDPVFGPVIAFGAGGDQQEVFQDRALALPPLNRFLARKLIESTRICRTLGAFRQQPPVHLHALENTLLAVSDLVCEIPALEELSIDPLIVDEQGTLAGAARMRLNPALGAGQARYGHMAIHPYPAHLSREWPMRDGQIVMVRAVRPEDAALTLDFFNRLSPETRYFRFMERIQELPPTLVARFTQVDYDREMALIALVAEPEGMAQIGAARYSLTADGESVEFALVVDDRWQRSGLGRRLMDALMDCAREKSYRYIVGDVLSDNQKMLRLMSSLGFSILPHPDGADMKRVVKPLQE
jgi:acetyltransferase